ncbi:SDR family oxidoreductase [Roseiterribacter gracilis]|uniref:NAD(P)-dependent oxidoreductase n=1 Tax=Roseiterribacter gracilis TaxID=2812848 RepID=A0A8S8XII2_9PROT|nr:NAD(P)-dependent oxidoreductase [Rhodospirillales bacterium TMPK1]
MHLFCFGYGDVARRLAARLTPHGWTIAGTVRDPARAAALNAVGVRAFAYDGSAALAESALDGVTHVLVSVPPPETIVAQHQLRGIPWLGYLSTTGVYGDHQGGWVDAQSTPVAPRTERARRRVEGEKAWLAIDAHVFRLAGIYGPGRNAIDDLRHGRTTRRIIKPGQVFSRCHVYDICSSLLASFERPNPGAIYDIADDEPASSAEVIEYAAAMLGIDPPPAVSFDDAAPAMSEMARSFYQECRRVSNARIKDELGVQLAFPTYREGLRAVVG